MTKTIETQAVSVRIEELNLSFGETEVLRGINLTTEPGEFFTFLGPSGSGKSTLLRAIAGFGPTPGGRILIGDDEVASLPPWKRNVGMVFQSYALWPHMTVRKNVAFGLEEHKVPKAEINERVDAALSLVGLLDYADRQPSQLSGGQQQRVALARTVVIEPRVLLLDEPLSNLDANLRVQMRREILDLQRKLHLTTIFVTHDQEEANTTSDRIAVLNDGTLQQVGTPMELYDKPTNLFVADFLGTANILHGRMTESEGRVAFLSEHGVEVFMPDLSKDARSIVFRPQNVTINTKAPPNGREEVRLSGLINHREFLGGIIRYAVDVGGHVVQVDDSHQRGYPPFNVGDKVGLSLESDQIVVLTH